MGNTVNDMQTYTQNSGHAQPPERRRKPRAKRVCHWYNLVWWIVLITALIVVQQLPKMLDRETTLPPVLGSSKAIGTENEAFLSLVFGRISATRELAISDVSFKKQLEALKMEHFSAVRLQQIMRWRQSDSTILPTKPVLLTFEEPGRETMEIADNALASLGMTGLVFVDVSQLDQGNIQLVSWHRLEELVKSGRWEVGISGCPNGEDQGHLSPAQLAQQREELERHLQVPVIAADCPRAWDSEYIDGEAVWRQALKTASLQVGFTAAPYGANYRNDSEFSLRRIRVSRTWDKTELISQLNSHTPRLQPFVDRFQSNRLASEWLVDHGEMVIEEGGLRMFNTNGERGALITLGGTEKWADADVQVRLKEQPEGQFWIILRYRTGQPYVRLGITKGQVLLQASERDTSIRQVASRNSPATDINLRLRVIGNRAYAYLNGQMLLTRPIEVSPDSDHGAFALAVWGAENTEVAAANVSAYVAEVKATPLFKKSGIFASRPGLVAWKQLREQSAELSMISPNYFAWIGGKPRVYKDRDTSIEIFSSHHRLKLLPALFIAEDTQLKDTSALIDQALLWVENPGYQGLNVILENAILTDEWRVFLDKLKLRMSKVNKSLTVTLLGGKDWHMPISENDNMLMVAADTNQISSEPKLLHPLSKALSIASGEPDAKIYDSSL